MQVIFDHLELGLNVTNNSNVSITIDPKGDSVQLNLSRKSIEETINKLLDGERLDRKIEYRGFSIDRSDIAAIHQKIHQRVSSQNLLVDNRSLFTIKFINGLSVQRRDLDVFLTENLNGKGEILEVEMKLIFFIGFNRPDLHDSENRVSLEKQTVFIKFVTNKVSGVKDSFVEFGVESTDFSWPDDIMALISREIEELNKLYPALTKVEVFLSSVYYRMVDNIKIIMPVLVLIVLIFFSSILLYKDYIKSEFGQLSSYGFTQYILSDLNNAEYRKLTLDDIKYSEDLEDLGSKVFAAQMIRMLEINENKDESIKYISSNQRLVIFLRRSGPIFIILAGFLMLCAIKNLKESNLKKAKIFGTSMKEKFNHPIDFNKVDFASVIFIPLLISMLFGLSTT